MVNPLLVLLFVVSAISCAFMQIWLLRRFDRKQLMSILRDESGSAYTVSFIMVMPIYVLFICVVIETQSILTAKVGTVYAAFATARSFSVWDSAASDADPRAAQRKAELAGAHAMVPFASGMREYHRPSRLNGTEQRKLAQFNAAYKDYLRTIGKRRAYRTYLESKYRYCVKHLETRIRTDQPKDRPEWDQDIYVTTRYEYPFILPAAAWVFGKKQANGRYSYKIETTVRLPSEIPRNPQRSIGIGYGRFNVP